ncbi:MAG: hypothetical protein ACPG6B_07225 [Oceanihabitans sp.]
MTSNNHKLIKYALAVVTLLLISYGGYSLFSTNPLDYKEIQSQKELVLIELQEMSEAYNNAIILSNEKDENLENAKIKIDNLIDSLKITESSIKELFQLKERQLELKSEMKNLVRENKELTQDNKILVHSLIKRKEQLTKSTELSSTLKKENDELEEEKEALNKTISEAKYLTLLDLTIAGVKERSSGKELITNKARRVNKFKVCYSIAKNELVNEGDKTMQVQILDNNNVVISNSENPLKIQDSNISYSFNTSFSYKNENLKVCDYFVFNKDTELEKGTYTINIYDRKVLVTTTTLTLK